MFNEERHITGRSAARAVDSQWQVRISNIIMINWWFIVWQTSFFHTCHWKGKKIGAMDAVMLLKTR